MAKLFRVTTEYRAAGQNMQNVLYVESELTAQQVCNDFHIHWAQVLAPIQVNSTQWQMIKAIEVAHLVLDPEYYELPISDIGAGGNFHTDPQLAVCVNLHTGLSGRKRRGRFFIGGVADELVEDGKLTVAGGGYVQTVLNNLTAHYIGVGAGVPLQVFSRKIFDSILNDIIFDSYKPVTVMQYNAVMSTMRSRKPSA